MLAAAGRATEFPANEIGSAVLAPYRRAILRLVEALHRFPAFVLDPMFNLEETNDVGRRMIPALASGARINLIDALLAPGPSRAQIVSFAEVAWAWHARFLRATTNLEPTGEREPLRERIEGYLRDVPRPTLDAAGDLVVCPTFRVGDRTIRTIGMTMRFGPTRDVTLEELAVDVLYPRDDEAERFFHELASG